MSDPVDFTPLTEAFDDLTAALQPGERRRLAGRMGTSLRAANAKRIRANVTPDGAPMVPRRSGGLRDKGPQSRSERGRARAQLMFRAASQPRFLRREVDENGVSVGFAGAMARIMRVHQYGLRDTVTRDPASPSITYPERPVLGLTPEDRLRMLGQVTDQLRS